MSLLSLHKISKHFGGISVLNEISLDFAAGSVTAIVGDNGAGKSTLLKVIAGSYSPDSGEVLFTGAPITSSTSHERRTMGIEMVYQDLALAPDQDVVTNLFMGRERLRFGAFLDRRAMREQAATLLDDLGIRIPRLQTRAGHLSGGQQQAVAIARAVMFSPQVILFDEPTAALAVREVDRVLSLIRQQKEHGRAIIFVSHRLNDVFAIADRIVVLKQGQILSDDPAVNLNLAQVVERIVS